MYNQPKRIMKTWSEAYAERLQRNETALIILAVEVLNKKPSIEVYHHKDRKINGLVFFDGENINSVSFHEVPYRWSGCGYSENTNSHPGKENSSMPFTAEEVLNTFQPVTNINHTYKEKFKNKAQYLKWCSYLTQLNPA